MEHFSPGPAPFRRSDYDVIVVGARCAGAPLSMLLAQAGARVLAIDRQAHGSDTLSTHALMRPAVAQLARWGLLDPLVSTGTPVVRSTTFVYRQDDKVEIPIRAEPGIPGLLAPRRTRLDALLVDAARTAGAEIVHEAVVHDLLRDASGRVSGVIVKPLGAVPVALGAGLVVGADGLGSTVARLSRGRIVHRGRVYTACVYGYADLPHVEGYGWYFGPTGSAGVIPTDGGVACVFTSVPATVFDGALRTSIAAGHAEVLVAVAPEIAERVAGTGLRRVRAFRGPPAIVREAHGPGWLLVGDAGLFRDPLTAHGISDAFRDAESAAHAILGGSSFDLHLYAEERDSLAWPVIEATEAICAFDWSTEELKAHHRSLSLAMKSEVAAITARGPLPGKRTNARIHAEALGDAG